jgi:glycosyltransferase involved in cell wall biosynthesis
MSGRIPDLSVIIPTHGRPDRLLLTLNSLRNQTADKCLFEVIVAIDRSQETEAALRAQGQTDLQLRWISSHAPGRAAARNTGARNANGHYFLFLDDDMEASPKLVETHLSACANHPNRANLGYFPIPEQPGETAASSYIRIWWDRVFERWAASDHQFGFKDFCTGNVSMPSALFRFLGGFSELFGPGTAGEDWEFGWRLTHTKNCELAFLPEAKSFHWTKADWTTLSRRAEEEGRGHVILSELHPAAAKELPIRYMLPAARRIRWRPSVTAAISNRLARSQSKLEQAGCGVAAIAVQRALSAACYLSGASYQLAESGTAT